MNKYPYIGEGLESGSVVVFYEQGVGTTLDSKTWASKDMKHHTQLNESRFKNITHEYLQNTYGEVVSPEHAEFIIELAELHGFVNCGYWEGDNVFLFKDNKLVFIEVKDASKSLFCAIEAKQITIPLPPKADKQESSGWVPKVGDEVAWCNRACSGEVKAIDGDIAWVKTKHNNYNTRLVRELKKPKTPEKELVDELIAKYKHLPKHEQACAIAGDIIRNAIDKYNITPKASK